MQHQSTVGDEAEEQAVLNDRADDFMSTKVANDVIAEDDKESLGDHNSKVELKSYAVSPAHSPTASIRPTP